MIPHIRELVAALVIGIGATLMMDAWNLFLARAFGVKSLNYCLLGRWVSHIPSGKFRHSSIANAEQRPNECVIGWITHYSIGLALALSFVTIVSRNWLMSPTLLPALLFGVITVVFPFFVLQPSLGFGVASSKTPNPAKARLKSFGTHTVFGIGLYLSALVVVELLHW